MRLRRSHPLRVSGLLYHPRAIDILYGLAWAAMGAAFGYWCAR